MRKQPLPFTPEAIECINKAVQTAALLRADLQCMNTALTTGGNSTAAERLAHDCLLIILTQMAPVGDAIRNLATAMCGD